MYDLSLIFPGFSVKCYVGVEPEGERWTACDLDRGMRTCYTKYNWSKNQRKYFIFQQVLKTWGLRLVN